MRSLRDILHQQLCNLPIRRNYAGKISWIKKFSQSTLRRKDIKEYEVYKKEILKLFALLTDQALFDDLFTDTLINYT